MPKANYDQIAPHYEAAINPLERWFLTKLRITALAQLPLNASLLELGAGTGLNFKFYPAGSRGVASEPSREMLKIAKSKDESRAISLVQSVAESMPFADATFDAGLATLVFCSVESPGAAFTELRRVVKPGGTIVLLEHVRPKGLLGLFFDLLNLITVPLFDDHFNRRTAAEAEARGLEVVKVERRLFGIINLITCRVKSSDGVRDD